MTLLASFVIAGADKEGDIPVDISYDIVRHVSAQLYTSPRKAIEELVCNSYDAGASECHLALPQTSKDPLIVLDNGKSMDFDGLKGLWQVARSPKAAAAIDGNRIANGRMQIGKFGVGKLAAFALGERLTHVTCVKDTVRVISVGQHEIKDKAGRKAPTFKVLKLTTAKAKDALKGLFTGIPAPWEHGWKTWTLALVEDIEEGTVRDSLRLHILKRMISTALPISSRFTVSLEKEVVPRRTIDADDIKVTVDVVDGKFRKDLTEALKAYWAERLDVPADSVPQARYKLTVEDAPNPEDTDDTVKALLVPGLGHVSGKAIATATTLTTAKLEERGYYDNGFAVTAHGKLVNPEDPLFGVTQRSHKYWSRFLARVEMPELDEVLLVQRNAVSETSPKAQIARTLLRALFNYVRARVDEREEATEAYDPGSFGKRLATSSPILGQAAIKGLLQGAVGPDDLRSLSIEFRTLGVAGPPSMFDPETKTIVINEDHPLIASLDEIEASVQMRRAMGEVLGGIEMGKGYLRARSVPADVLRDVDEVLDSSLRSAAEFVRDPVEDHIQRIHDASFEGDTPFEKAVVEAFQSLRLAARHHGESDAPDGVIEIPLSGKENLRVSIEAKGSKGVITHKELSEATIARHNAEFQCQHGIAIAREFAKGGLGGKPSALIRETQGKVPLLTVEAMAQMLRLHKKRNFTYDKVAKILTTWKHPDESSAFINEVWREMPELGLMRLILTVAHDLASGDATNLPDPGMIVGNERIRKKRIPKEDVIRVLLAVELTTHMITIVDRNDYRFELNAPVQTILDAMAADCDSLGASG